MRCLIVLCLLVAVAIAAPSSGDDSKVPNRGCIWILGKCSRKCEEGTHSYVPVGGCGYKTPEATCEEPNPVPEEHKICDFSACYCDEGTVKDTKIGKCVKLEDCSK